MEINGKFYGMWGQFVEKKDTFIGGQLEDVGDSIDMAMGMGKMITSIIDIKLEPNKESALFSVVGELFTCNFDVRYGSIVGGADGWITFSGYMGHTWRIKPLEEVK